MKSILKPAALTLAIVAWLPPAPVQAAGCLKGAAVGGVAGHFAGHHGMRQTNMRVNARSRAGHLATAVSPATPLASAKAPVVPEGRLTCRHRSSFHIWLNGPRDNAGGP